MYDGDAEVSCASVFLAFPLPPLLLLFALNLPCRLAADLLLLLMEMQKSMSILDVVIRLHAWLQLKGMFNNNCCCCCCRCYQFCISMFSFKVHVCSCKHQDQNGAA
jgi:hypothetical protein